jgi:hypothetical protein
MCQKTNKKYIRQKITKTNIREKPNKCKQNITSSSPPNCSSKALFISSLVTRSSSNLSLKHASYIFFSNLKSGTKNIDILRSNDPIISLYKYIKLTTHATRIVICSTMYKNQKQKWCNFYHLVKLRGQFFTILFQVTDKK